ncbi:MAG: hypothetical protein JST26_15975 [Bacteroidetes bacterium]|nr:hypothetical protein [Bacteroidota bacterium]
METWTKLSFYVAVLGWCMSFVVHVLSLFGFDVGEKIPLIGLLHFGIFIVWLPTVIRMKLRQDEMKTKKANGSVFSNANQVLKALFENTPAWLKIVAIICFIYAPVNFVIFAMNQTGSPAFENGEYMIRNHGELIRVITADEYHSFLANELRGFSGHWLFFYGLSAASLFPFGKQKEHIKKSDPV